MKHDPQETTHEEWGMAMDWQESRDNEIERLISTQDVSEVVAKAVSSIASAATDAVLVKLGHGVGCDPEQTRDFGERLLCAAIDKLRSDIRRW